MEVVVEFAGPIRARPTAVGLETLPARSPRRAPFLWPACVSRGWPEMSPTAKTYLALKRVKTTKFGVHRFWGIFSRVLELKMSVLGLGFYLERKTRFI